MDPGCCPSVWASVSSVLRTQPPTPLTGRRRSRCCPVPAQFLQATPAVALLPRKAKQPPPSHSCFTFPPSLTAIGVVCAFKPYSLLQQSGHFSFYFSVPRSMSPCSEPAWGILPLVFSVFHPPLSCFSPQVPPFSFRKYTCMCACAHTRVHTHTLPSPITHQNHHELIQTGQMMGETGWPAQPSNHS